MIKDKGKVNEGYKKEFLNALENDLNTPQALAVVWKLLDDKNLSHADMKATILDFDKVLGLDLDKFDTPPEEILQLKDKMDRARQQKNFEESDKIRNGLENKGWKTSIAEDQSIIYRV